MYCPDRNYWANPFTVHWRSSSLYCGGQSDGPIGDLARVILEDAVERLGSREFNEYVRSKHTDDTNIRDGD